jgi:hypothetical protein
MLFILVRAFFHVCVLTAYSVILLPCTLLQTMGLGVLPIYLDSSRSCFGMFLLLPLALLLILKIPLLYWF